MEPSASLSERAYSITKSYHRINGALMATIALALTVCFVIVFSNLMRLNSKITQLNLVTEFSEITLGLYMMFGALVFTLAFSLVIVTLRGRKRNKEMREWMEDYLYGAYVLNFATTIPKGDTVGERVFSIAKYVFPELRRLKKNDQEADEDVVKRSTDKSYGSYTYDLALRTTSGYFVVKDFKDKVVAMEDVKLLARSATKSLGRNKIFRLVCLAKNYEQVFLDSDKLEEEIRKIGSPAPIDVLLDAEKGYTVVRVSSSI